MSGPLVGIRVLDLSSMLSGPWTADILGDQGADVIKVEPPAGDHTRALREDAPHGLGPTFLNINRSKRSISLDLKSRDGIAALRTLIASADVLVQNFRPGTAERLGIGYGDVCELNPRLVYVSISGFGESGPFAARRVYDPVVQALSGLMTVQGGSDGARPKLVRTVLPDKLTAMAGAQAACAALIARGRTGVGQHVRLSMLDTVIAFLWASDMNAYTFADEPIEPAKAASAIDLIYETAEGYITVSTMQDREWQAFCAAAQRPDLLADERFDTPTKRQENIDARLGAIQAVLLERTADEWAAVLGEHGVPCAPVLRRSEVIEHPQVLASGTVVESAHPLAGRLRQARPAARFGATPLGAPRGAPRLGQHTAEILAELGFGAAEIERLTAGDITGGENRAPRAAGSEDPDAVVSKGA
jgi:crotonobetainyl-CoA:carnitine CoA-transferase CaiB-like acyl-CoA transferase